MQYQSGFKPINKRIIYKWTVCITIASQCYSTRQQTNVIVLQHPTVNNSRLSSCTKESCLAVETRYKTVKILSCLKFITIGNSGSIIKLQIMAQFELF